MNFANISLGSHVEIDPSTSINNVIIKDGVRIAKRCSIYGGPDNLLELGTNGYVGMNSVLNGFAAKLNIMVDSGPNASPGMMKLFPIVKGPITIGNDTWIGASAIIMPNVTLGEFCIVAANSFVNKSFPAFSIIGGSPAKLIRSFTEEEKEKVLNKEPIVTQPEISTYETNYLDLPFEDILRKYRKKNILAELKRYPHARFLEIGCGPDPLFQIINDYDKMVVVEPGKTFFKMAESMAAEATKVIVINDQIENLVDNLKKEEFDFIVIGGFLHEIDNPDAVLQAVRLMCSDNTIIYSFVPNARSFHRLLAYQMGIIGNIYQRSEHDELFERKNVYDRDTFNELFTRNKFKIIDSGSYFVKPFAHSQMDDLLNRNIIDKSFLDGLNKMITYLPDFGSELWNSCKIDD
jgi:acetyltransferase-like isoleucine patch superfamily enzyme/2-polyprenyl-3-methyl-5-hydroxy-6-metoxy-1,4-benzoquinol methylase